MLGRYLSTKSGVNPPDGFLENVFLRIDEGRVHHYSIVVMYSNIT